MKQGGEIEPTGAYGLKLTGLEQSRHLLGPAPPEWSPWTLRHAALDEAADEGSDEVLTPDHARLRQSIAGWLEMNRLEATSTLLLPEEPTAHELVHPYLGLTAAVAARWRGRPSFHAGGFEINDSGWGILGDKERGKSSTLAWLELEGRARVISDDVLVVDLAGRALAGPRCVDLREGAARHLDAGELIGSAGGRDRWRLVTVAVPASVALRGWIELSWGDGIDIVPMLPRETFEALVRNLSLNVPPPDYEELLALARLPGWRLTRPRQFTEMVEATERLLEVVQAPDAFNHAS